MAMSSGYPARRVAALLTSGAIALTGCAGTGTPGAAVPARAPAAAAAGQQAAGGLGTLAPRRIAAGECGMFLWTQSIDRNLVLFSDRAGTAWAVLDGQEVAIRRTEMSGTELLGQFERQTFDQGRYRLSVTVEFERRAALQRGAVVPQGTIRIRQGDGWETIVPVAGLVGCENS